ncbi:MAG: PIG-L family deacetylase [Vicinamibacteraceae bacterium]
MPRLWLGSAAAVVLTAALLSVTPSAQVRPVYSRGVAGLVQAVERLRTTASAMHTAAHPDDEDTALIARLARGDHARVAYLSLNRGEGGQNIIGTELFDALGVIRTEELLQARTLDGGDQFFTRAYDFGFTKTMAEAGEKWNETVVLGDMVRAIRRYRPLVILNGWSGTPSDGHGQHQLAGKLAPLAFAAAADPAKYPEQIAEGLRPWQARKLYVRHGFGADPASATLRLPTGIVDPLLGRSFNEIAMEGRSQHKSQEMGVVEARGVKTSNLRLVANLTTTPIADERTVFDGLDTSLTGLAALAGLPAGALAAELKAMDTAAAQALASADIVRAPEKLVPVLVRGLTAARAARTAAAGLSAPAGAKAEAEYLLAIKVAQFEDAVVRASGIVVDALADREIASAGDAVRVNVNLFQADGAPVTAGPSALVVPAGWSAKPAPPSTEGAGTTFARFFREEPTRAEPWDVTIAADAPPTEPYWLRTPRTGPVFTWTGVPTALQTRPFDPPLLVARVPLTIGGTEITVERPVVYRYADAVRGEIRREVQIVPAVTVAFDEPLAIVPAGAAAQPRNIRVRVRSETLPSGPGVVRVVPPAGWQVTPAGAPIVFASRGEGISVPFVVTPPSGVAPGAYTLTAQVAIAGRTFDTSMQAIDYPHIQKHRLYAPAQMTTRVLDLAVAPVTVGYVMGGGDRVPEAIRRLGLGVTLLTDDDLASGDLSRYGTIVVGVRASESRPAFVAANARLLQFVRDGGTLIVQYQQTDYTGRSLSPFPAGGNVRVTDERAPVTILEPTHPAFTTPNRITGADWDDWVQERDLYAWATFDPQYTPLLATGDPGEPLQRGGELYARIGKGHYVYTSYAWFRQLPAGVPGAYRMFANLLSLGRK